MTSPAFTGHPDWQGGVQQRGFALVAESQVFPAGNNVLGIFPVAAWSGLTVQASLTSGQATIVIDHVTDSIPSNVLLSDQWEIVTATGLVVTLPLIANWVRIRVVVPAAQTGNVTIIVLPSIAAINGKQYPWVGDVLGAGSAVINASAQLIDHFNLIRPGLVKLYLNPHDTAGKIFPFVYHAGPSGAGDIAMWAQPAPVAQQYYEIAVPDQPWILLLGNSDATAAHTIDYAVTYNAVSP